MKTEGGTPPQGSGAKPWYFSETAQILAPNGKLGQAFATQPKKQPRKPTPISKPSVRNNYARGVFELQVQCQAKDIHAEHVAFWCFRSQCLKQRLANCETFVIHPGGPKKA